MYAEIVKKELHVGVVCFMCIRLVPVKTTQDFKTSTAYLYTLCIRIPPFDGARMDLIRECGKFNFV